MGDLNLKDEKNADSDELEKIIKRWENEEGTLIMIFHAIQDYYGYVPRDVAMKVSSRLNIPLAQIYEVITFYHYFNLEPPAEYTFAVWTGTACYLKGAPAIIEELKKRLKIKPDEFYSEDKKFKITEVRCLGCCGLAPVMTVNGEVFGKVKPEEIVAIIEKTVKK